MTSLPEPLAEQAEGRSLPEHAMRVILYECGLYVYVYIYIIGVNVGTF